MSHQRTRRALGAAAVAITSLATTMVVANPAAAQVLEPDDDPFYDPPAGFESTDPGTVLRSREVTVTGFGIPVPVESTQALIRSTDATGDPIAIVSTYMEPATPAPEGGRQLVSYQPATDSLGDQCNPSYTLQAGTEKELALAAMALSRGWAVVMTDYQGPLDAYAAGQLEGRTVLDGVRGVESLPDTDLDGVETPVGLWGYSGGGIASGWAAELQPSYAPELNIVGVASGGTPSDLRAAKTLMDGSPFAGLLIGGAVGMSREYPQIESVLNDEGRAMLEQVDDMCVAELATALPFRRLNEFTTVEDPFEDPAVAPVLDENTMGSSAPTAPVFLYHSVFDELIPYSSAQTLHENWCAGGATVQLYTDFLSEHNSFAVTGAPLAVAYLGNRFAGQPAPTNC